MHVICKKCGHHIPVAGRPGGSTNIEGVALEGNVHVEGGKISFGEGGAINFGSGGSISFGPPEESEFACPKCRHVAGYTADEITDD